MLSNMHAPTFTIVPKKDYRHRRQDGEFPTVNKAVPSVILDYNKHMHGVDRADQIAKYHTITRKTFKWWKKLAFHLLNFSTNAEEHPMSQYKFREELVKVFVSQHATMSSHKGRRYAGNPIRRLIERHFPQHIPHQEGAKKVNPTRVCHVCATTVKKTESRYWCPICEVPLCVVGCFERFHMVKYFRQGTAEK